MCASLKVPHSWWPVSWPPSHEYYYTVQLWKVQVWKYLTHDDLFHDHHPMSITILFSCGKCKSESIFIIMICISQPLLHEYYCSVQLWSLQAWKYLNHHDDEALQNIQQPTWGSLLSQCKQRHTHTHKESEGKITNPGTPDSTIQATPTPVFNRNDRKTTATKTHRDVGDGAVTNLKIDVSA